MKMPKRKGTVGGLVVFGILFILSLCTTVYGQNGARGQASTTSAEKRSEYGSAEEVIFYPTILIPIVSGEVEDFNEFRQFLEDNTNRVVRFNSVLEFTPFNYGVTPFVEYLCDTDDFLRTVEERPALLYNKRLGLPTFHEGFVPLDKYKPQLYDNIFLKKYMQEHLGAVSCRDTLRIIMKDPSRLHVERSGTGIVGVPFKGDFKIERRLLSGGSVEFTLIEQ